MLALSDEITALLQQADGALLETADGLCLQGANAERLCIDFLAGKNRHRRQFGGGLGQAIAKACLCKDKPSILDLTAGLGRDSFILASLGARVIMLERSPVLAMLLADALTRAKVTMKALSLSLVHVDALSYLNQLVPSEFPEVIYFDPMHPERKKSALVKKELRLVRALVGTDEDKLEVFIKALSIAKKRVVVKWPAKAKPIGERQPSFSYTSKTTRFDVFINNRASV